MSELDREIKRLLEESAQITFNEYCKTCYQYREYCDGCRMESGTGEPEMYLSARDMLLECELESCND